VNCKETPDLGECKARAAACELSEAMAEWKSRNETLQDIQGQLRRLCNGELVRLSPEMRELAQALGVPDSEDQDEIKPLRRSCPTGIDESVPDVREWLKGKPWLVQQAFAVPGTLDPMGKDILLRGTIAFAFLSTGISAFFPKLGSDPKSLWMRSLMTLGCSSEGLAEPPLVH